MSDRISIRRDRRAVGRLAIVAALAVVLAVVGGVALVALTDDDEAADEPAVETPGSLAERWSYEAETGMSENHHEIAVATVDGEPVVAVPINGLDDTEQCRLEAISADGERRWRADVPPANCSAHAVGDASAGDVDGDGAAEFAVGTGEHAVLAVDAESGEERFRGPMNSIGYSAPLLLGEGAAANESGGPAMVAADFTGGVHGYDANGSRRFSRTLEGSVWASPVAVDAAPGASAAVAHGQLGRFGEIVVLDDRGEPVRRIDLSDAPMTMTEPGDEGVAVAATWSGEVVAADLRAGERRWARSLAEGVSVGATADGRVFLTTPGGHVRALDRETGETVWSAGVAGEHDHEHDHDHEDAGGHSAPAPIVGDVDGDDAEEVVAVAGDGTVAVFDAGSGDLLARHALDGEAYVRPTAADVAGDGADEVLVLLGEGRVVALSYSE